MVTKRSIEDKFVLFDDPSECARAAAPVFEAQRWRWAFLHGFPKEHNILNTLLGLQEDAAKAPEPYIETGRLVYYHGQFGYQRPKE